MKQKKTRGKRIIETVIAVILVLSMCFQTVFAKGNSNRRGKTIRQVINDNGIEYTITVKMASRTNFEIEFVNEKTHDKTTLDYSEGKAYRCEYAYKGNGILKTEKYKKVKEERLDYSEEVLKQIQTAVSASGYGSKVAIKHFAYKYGGKNYYHYYRVGNGSDAGYVEMGCVKTYRVKSDAPYVKDFINSVNKSNYYYGQAKCSVGAAVAAVVIMFAAPSKIAATAVLSALGLDAGAIAHLWTAYSEYKSADTYFDLAKAYGTKID